MNIVSLDQDLAGIELDADTQSLLYSDSFATNRPGASVLNEAESNIRYQYLGS